MIDPEVSIGVHDGAKEPADDAQEWEIEQFLELETHLGDFASEGLRTLVLGMKVLTEDQLTEWLRSYKEASTAMKGRDEKLTKAALALEKELFIVGATAIEDKLQKNVPKTIAKLSQAGIKLWVLTGDKRETAVEIGYSTAVLTPKMHVTEVADEGLSKVRTQLAMEFIKLVKVGTLRKYQRAMINAGENRLSWENFVFRTAKVQRKTGRFLRKQWIVFLKLIRWFDKEYAADRLHEIEQERIAELKMVRPAELRRNVRNRAEAILKDYLDSQQNQKSFRRLNNSGRAYSIRQQQDPSTSHFSDRSFRQVDDVPLVFNRAKLSKNVLTDIRAEKMLGNRQKSLMIGKEGVEQIRHLEEEVEDDPLVDVDCLSMDSRAPMADHEIASDFDRKRLTFLERFFAVDSEVRKGRLAKHLKKNRLGESAEGSSSVPDHANEFAENDDSEPSIEGPRALVIEGAALVSTKRQVLELPNRTDTRITDSFCLLPKETYVWRRRTRRNAVCYRQSLRGRYCVSS